MAFEPVLHGALDAFKAHVTYTHRILQEYCEQMASPDGDLMSQTKILKFSEWLVDEAVQQNGARYSFRSVGPSPAVPALHSSLAIPSFGLVCAVIIYATSMKSAESSTHRAASPQMYLHPWRSRQLETPCTWQGDAG